MNRLCHVQLVLLLCLVLVVAACRVPGPSLSPSPGVAPLPTSGGIVPLPDAHLDGDAQRAYLDRVGGTPQEARYYDLVDKALQLTPAEVDKLAQNGFVVTDRLAWSRFVEAYAWVYWQDLPVLVTTDSLLHAVHQSYDDLLIDLEGNVLSPGLDRLLKATHTRLQADRAANTDRDLDALYTDVDTYLSVARALLAGEQGAAGAVHDYVALATAADSVVSVELFGGKRDIDFTLLKPRGHYTRGEWLSQYFRAMAWLAQIDFRFVEYDPLSSQPSLSPTHVAAAIMLRDAVDGAGARETWSQIDGLVQVLVGASDNTTLPDLDRFLSDAGLGRPSDALKADKNALLSLLITRDYGQQRITGQLLARHSENAGDQPIPRPVSFMLLGQRFAIDSYVMSNLVYDRLIVDGQAVKRALPSSLDVMAALGSDRAVTHLAAELSTYGYEGHLAALRQQVEALGSSFWQAPVYNQWLRLIRALNGATTAENYPQAMRTAAWADKSLHTQLASWAQLRHDNILYVKQSFTAMVVCQYPAGYVEPYPEFYAALYDMARTNSQALSGLDLARLAPDAGYVRDGASDYFQRVMDIASRLKTMAEKELRLEPFDADEEAFIKGVIVRKDEPAMGCGGPTFEDQWTGWYLDLFYRQDADPALIADVHTNPNDDPSSGLAPARVLHAATGPAVPLLLIVDTDEGTTVYVGPSFTYFDVIEEGFPPVRLTDEQWRARLGSNPYPAAPAWTAGFRVPTDGPPEILALPEPDVPR